HRMETHPAEAPINTVVRLIEFCAVHTILSRSSLVALARHSGWDPAEVSFGVWLRRSRKFRGEPRHGSSIHSSAIAYADQNAEHREALEAEFEQSLLHTIAQRNSGNSNEAVAMRPSLQLYTCIDDRECSFRRHVELAN